MLYIIRTCLLFHVPMLALPRDHMQNMSILQQRVKGCVQILPMRENFHRLESTDAADLLNMGKRFQDDFGGEARTGVEAEEVTMRG
jgi:hypothetical protein